MHFSNLFLMNQSINLMARIAVLSSLMIAAACSSSSDNKCTPGRVVDCSCIGGGVGVQTCQGDGTYGPCDCGENLDGGVVIDSDGEVSLSDAAVQPDSFVETDGHVSSSLCDSFDDCTPPAGCVGGGCVDPVPDPGAYAEAAGSRRASYTWALQVPALYQEREVCCFDFTGNGTPDNAYGDILPMMDMLNPDMDSQEKIDLSIENGDQVLVLDWVELPEEGDGEIRISFFHGVLNNENGLLDLLDRRAGLGRVLLDPDSFGDYGSHWQINHANISSGVVAGQGGPLLVYLPGVFFVGSNVLHPHLIHDVRIEGIFSMDLNDCQGMCSVDELRDMDGAPFLAGGLRLGGVILADDLFSDLDDKMRACTCAGVDPSLPVVEWSYDIDEGIMIVGCNPANHPEQENDCTAGSFCEMSYTSCQYLGINATLFDVDSNGDGVNNALSIGLRLGLAGVSIDGLVDP